MSSMKEQRQSQCCPLLTPTGTMTGQPTCPLITCASDAECHVSRWVYTSAHGLKRLRTFSSLFQSKNSSSRRCMAMFSIVGYRRTGTVRVVKAATLCVVASLEPITLAFSDPSYTPLVNRNTTINHTCYRRAKLATIFKKRSDHNTHYYLTIFNPQTDNRVLYIS